MKFSIGLKKMCSHEFYTIGLNSNLRPRPHNRIKLFTAARVVFPTTTAGTCSFSKMLPDYLIMLKDVATSILIIIVEKSAGFGQILFADGPQHTLTKVAAFRSYGVVGIDY